MKNKTKILILKETNKGRIKTNLWLKLDNLNNILVYDLEHAKYIIVNSGFKIEFTLRNEVFFRGNGLKKTRCIEIKDFENLKNE